MAGKLTLCASAALAALMASALAEPAPASTPKKQGWLNSPLRRPGSAESPDFENVRKALDALTPEQRKRFQENFWRWANLTPEEKKALRGREEVRKKVVQEEVEAALQESGLTLEGERREQFAKRYGQERRKIEEQLRKEMNEQRKPLVREMMGRLKEEFSAPTVPVTPAP